MPLDRNEGSSRTESSQDTGDSNSVINRLDPTESERRLYLRRQRTGAAQARAARSPRGTVFWAKETRLGRRKTIEGV